jgi:ribonuclease D
VLGFALEKGHSAADWSTRPLPDDWLRYAALDVEVLIELRDALADQLREQGKWDWAAQEFAAIAEAPLPTPRVDPWRRTSGLHRVRKPRQLAAVRELWAARDQMARRRDTAPGRILPDAAIIDAAQTMPVTRDELLALPVYGGRSTRRHVATWFEALERARSMPDDALPATQAPNDGPPPARSWGDKDPVAATRLAALRAAVAAIADEHTLPTENLLAPDTVRRVAWKPPPDHSERGLRATLGGYGARPWQVDLTARALAKALDRLERQDLPAEAPDQCLGDAGQAR